MGRMSRPATILALFMLASGCASEDKNMQPCPTKGIGVEAPNGTSCYKAASDPSSEAAKACRDQFENYKGYSCSEPQICADVGLRLVPEFVLDPKAPGEPISFTLTNCSTGNSKITISKILLVGDDRCSFVVRKDNQATGDVAIEDKVIDPGKYVSIQTVYWPLTEGEDHAAIHVFSNAKNFSPLVIPVCGRAVVKNAMSQDSGPSSGSDGGTAKGFQCKEVGSKVNTTCHKE